MRDQLVTLDAVELDTVTGGASEGGLALPGAQSLLAWQSSIDARANAAKKASPAPSIPSMSSGDQGATKRGAK